MACSGRRHCWMSEPPTWLIGLGRAWLAAAVLCYVAFGAALAHAAVDYKSNFMIWNLEKETDNPEERCIYEHGGFPPNLLNSAKEEEMQKFAQHVLGYIDEPMPLSGTIGTSACTEVIDCMWQWRGGPLADEPETFYVGNAGDIEQDPEKKLYSRWFTGYPVNPTKNPRAYMKADFAGWLNLPMLFGSRIVLCEIIVSLGTTTVNPKPQPTASAPTTPDDPSENQKSSSSFPWWVGIIVAVVVAIIAILTVVLLFRCCRGKKVAEADEEETEAGGSVSGAVHGDAEQFDLDRTAHLDEVEECPVVSIGGGVRKPQAFRAGMQQSGGSTHCE